MARRTLNRHELRKQAELAEQQGQPTPEAPAAEKAPKAAKPKKPRKKKEPPRLCARWAVYDGSMKQVAVFDYSQRDQADQKVAELAAKKNASYFIQLVKEPMPEPAPA